MKPAAAFGLAALGGLLLVFTYPNASGGGWPGLAFVALVPLLVALARETGARRRFLLGYAAGNIYWFGTCYWIQFVLAEHGGIGEAGGWGAFLLFCLAKSMHFGVFAWLAGAVIEAWWAIPAIAALWVAIERTHGPLGFAWLALGNAATDMPPLMRLAPWAGVYGVSFAIALIAAAAATIVRRRPKRHLLWLALLLPLLVLPAAPAPEPGTDSAVTVQPNIDENMQWTRQSLEDKVRKMTTVSLESALAQPAPAVILWPEEPAPFYFYDDAGFREQAVNLARVARTPFLFGSVAHTPKGEPLNSAVLLDSAGANVERYDKILLVPFGEFIPPLFGWIQRISTEAGDFVSGSREALLPVGSHRAAAFICYESAFPYFVRDFVRSGAEALFNLSNDGYFGKSSARLQHLLLVRMRAAENRRWIVRATNDGLTVSVDPAGRVAASLPPYVETARRLPFSWRLERTLYTRCGDWFVWLCALGSVAALAPPVAARIRR